MNRYYLCGCGKKTRSKLAMMMHLTGHKGHDYSARHV